MITFSLVKWYEFNCKRCSRQWCVKNWVKTNYCGAVVCPHCGILDIPVEEDDEKLSEADAITDVLNGRC